MSCNSLYFLCDGLNVTIEGMTLRITSRDAKSVEN